jgi:hypothetical protein
MCRRVSNMLGDAAQARHAVGPGGRGGAMSGTTAKGFRFYLLDGERIVHVLSWHQVQSADDLGQALKKVKDTNLMPEETVRLCVVGDGAK